jgi:hypothetical protein
MSIDPREIPVRIPFHIVKRAPYDGDAEIWNILNTGLRVDDFLIKAPVLGVYSMLETFECKMVGDPANATLLDCVKMLYINEHRKECAQEVSDWVASTDKDKRSPIVEEDFTEFDWTVWRWAHRAIPSLRRQSSTLFKDGLNFLLGNSETVVETDEEYDDRIGILIEKIYHWVNQAFSGYSMIPSVKSDGGSEYWFGAESVGSLIASIGSDMCVPYDKLIWETPVCLISHTIAQKCKVNGNDNISRPIDKDDLKRWMRKARQCVVDGELFPWQIEDSLNYRLSDVQLKYGGDKLQKKFDKLQAEARQAANVAFEEKVKKEMEQHG